MASADHRVSRRSTKSNEVGQDPADVEMFAALARVLDSGAFVVDVGANEGQFIHALRRTVAIRAACLEPGADAFSRLRKSLVGIEGIEALNLAASATTSTSDFFISRSDIGSSLLRPVPGQVSRWAQTVAVECVQAFRLDELAEAKQWQRIDLLKVDTQGSDLDVLASAGSKLDGTTIGAALVEVNFHQLYEGQASFGAICNLMEGKGYFLAELFRRYNRLGWLWYADALFLPRTSRFAT